MVSIAEELADLINPNPTFDPEDDFHEETRAKLIDKELLENDADVFSSGIHKTGGLRSSLALKESDPKYEGKIVSRKELNVESDDSFDGIFIEENEMDDANEIIDYFSENENSDNTDENDEDIESADAKSSDENDEYGPGLFKTSKSEVTEKEKGKDTMNQLTLWECILEARIKVQKLLNLANQVPRPEVHDEFVDQGGDELADSVRKATSSLTKLGSELFILQGKLLDQVEEENSADEADNESETIKTSEHYSNQNWNNAIEKRCSRLRNRRNRILQYWYDRTLLATSKVNKSFSSFERPTVAQIDHILADRDRLIRRTRVQRTAYRVLGTSGNQPKEKEQHDAHLKEVEEIFDDDDFYQQLLRQFIEQKTSQPGSSDTMQDSIEMTRKWLKLQQFKTKAKKDVDHKTRKGKKVRYVVHSKLVSFMAPMDRSTWSHESRNQLVKSVFGKSLISTGES